MRLRMVSRLIVVTLVVVVGAVLFLHQRLDASQAPAQAAPATSLHLSAGTPLDGIAAPDFHLRDQTGAPISLAQFQGRPVVLTFMDATCTDQCPITAQYLDYTAQFLGPQAKNVAWVAISVNPANTGPQFEAFLKNYHVQVPIRLVMGTQAQLQPLWNAYHISVVPPKTPGGDVQHTVATYLIDKQGHERELLDPAYDSQKAAQDLQALLKTAA